MILHPLCRSSVSLFQLSFSTYFPPDTTNHKHSQAQPCFMPMTLLMVHAMVLSGVSRCPIPPGSPSFPPHHARDSTGPTAPQKDVSKGPVLQPWPLPLASIISLTAVNISLPRNVFTYGHISNSFIKLNYLTREIACFDCVAVLLKPT